MVIRLIEGSLVVWIVGVLSWVGPMSLISSDGIPKARNVGEDEVPVTFQFPVCPFRSYSFVDVSFLLRNCSRDI